MDPLASLAALALLGVGSVLLGLSVWSRAGRSPASRAWARRGSAVGAGHDYRESVVLVVVPMIGQLCLVGGVLAALGSIDAVHGATLGTLIGAVVVVEIVLCVVLLAVTSYRAVMPLWIYPAWLLEDRRRQRERIRAAHR